MVVDKERAKGASRISRGGGGGGPAVAGVTESLEAGLFTFGLQRDAPALQGSSVLTHQNQTDPQHQPKAPPPPTLQTQLGSSGQSTRTK